MKRLLIIPVLMVLLASCERDKFPKYKIAYERVVPDSLIEKCNEYTNKLVSSASFHLNAGDYEDPEDVIREANRVSTQAYSITVQGLNVYNCNGCGYDFIPEYNFTREQAIIFQSLKTSTR